MTTPDHDSDPDLKTCIGCGRSFPATVEYFPKAGKNSRGETLLRPRCKPCHSTYAAVLKARSDELRHEYDRGGARHRPAFSLPPGCELGERRQLGACPEGQGLPVLMGPGGKPVLRRAGVELHEGEICVVLG